VVSVIPEECRDRSAPSSRTQSVVPEAAVIATPVGSEHDRDVAGLNGVSRRADAVLLTRLISLRGEDKR